MRFFQPGPQVGKGCIDVYQSIAPFSALAVGHDEGYTLYHLRSIENLEKAHEGKNPKKTCIVERLFSSSLICLVSLNHTRKLQVYHYQKDNEICTHAYPSAILSIRMNRKVGVRVHEHF